MKEFIFKDKKNRDIYCYKWDDVEQIKGIVLIVHGAREHARRYHDIAMHLNQQGYVVYGIDHLGHGKTRGEDDFVYFSRANGFQDVVDNIIQLKDIIREEYPDKGIIIYGHSMGSFITRYTISKYPKVFEAVILSGTTHQPPILVNAVKNFGKAMKFFKGEKNVSKLFNFIIIGNNIKVTRKRYNIKKDYEWLTKDQELIPKIEADTFMDPYFTLSASVDMFTWLEYISNPANINELNKDVPILLISGYEDPLSDYGKAIKKVAKLYKKQGFEDVEYKIYENMRHEVHNEVGKETVYNDVTSFLNQFFK